MAKDLEIELNRILSEYGAEVQEKLDKVLDEEAEEGVKKLKISGKAKGWKKYPNSWGVEKRGTARILRSTRGQLTHLLEYGHALRQGGRARAFPHIKSVELEINKKIEQRVKEIIENK